MHCDERELRARVHSAEMMLQETKRDIARLDKEVLVLQMHLRKAENDGAPPEAVEDMKFKIQVRGDDKRGRYEPMLARFQKELGEAQLMLNEFLAQQ